MKYRRLRITNYRGVDSCEIEFETCGLTLVQGPNEVGKTSLGEAIGVLFEYPDSSKHSIIKAIRPTHRDAGPEIELQAECGPYRFTYFKRFHKKPETKLTISAPAPENHTGREAHDRAEQILQETLDINLWRALTIQQGEAIAQPNLTNQQSLSAALDKAAGGVPVDPEEEGLFEKVVEECGRFYTPTTGKEKSELKDAHQQLQQDELRVSELQGKLDHLDQDIENAARIQAELPSLKRREIETKNVLDEQSRLLLAIESLEKQLSEARLKRESANKTAEMARRDTRERQQLIESVDCTNKNYQDLRQSSAQSVGDFERAEHQFDNAEKAIQQSGEKKLTADKLANIRRADFDYYNNRLFLDQLGERKQRIDAARKDAASASEFIEKTKVDRQTLKKIEQSELGVLTAKAKLETAAPSVSLIGLAPCDIVINDNQTHIKENENRELPVADRLRICIPNQIEIEISAGSSTDELAKQVAEAKQTLDAICRSVGVDDPDSARIALDKRREATRKIEEKDRIAQENLRDLTYDHLADKLLRLEQTVPEYLANRANTPPIAADLGMAKTARDDAESALKESTSEWNVAQDAVTATRGIRDELNKENESVRVQLRSLKNDLRQQRSRLESARKTNSDDKLENAGNEAEQAVSAQQENVETAEASLNARNPEKINALAETAESSLGTIKKRGDAAQAELIEVTTRLKIHGEEGLHEKLQIAKTSLQAVTSNNRSLFRRAHAVKLLYDIMCAEREQARQAYVAPLKERVERLGRLVFDESFQVEIDENLQIINRTSGGITVPFHSLSGGTREQLSLIFRLACSMIVAEQGGMPLIMDDALGYTDPERLRLMGAVLAKAAKQCQIVIFTCVPERYGNIGDAKIVSL